MIERIKDHEKENMPLIIFMSSISAYTLSVMRWEYCISKAAMAMLARLLAFAFAEYGINVYEIRPGNILSDMTLPVKERFNKLIADGLHPIRSWGTGEDCALAVSAICKGYLPYSTETAWQIARCNRIVCLIAHYQDDPQKLPLRKMYGKNLVFKTSGVHANACTKTLELIKNGKLDTSFLITHRFPLNKTEEAYRMFETQEDNVIKVAIMPWQY